MLCWVRCPDDSDVCWLDPEADAAVPVMDGAAADGPAAPAEAEAADRELVSSSCTSIKSKNEDLQRDFHFLQLMSIAIFQTLRFTYCFPFFKIKDLFYFYFYNNNLLLITKLTVTTYLLMISLKKTIKSKHHLFLLIKKHLISFENYILG